MIVVRQRIVNPRPIKKEIKRRNNSYISNPSALINAHVIAKYPDDHEFGFDIKDPLEWRKWLHKYRTKVGNPLPRITPDGNIIIYDVYKWGGQPPNTSLFPGYDKDKKRRHPIKYGAL